MHTDRNRWRWLTGSLLIVLLSAGCFQQTGVAPEPLASIEPGPTNTFPSPPTDFPTPEPLPTTAELPTQELFQQQDIPTTDPFLSGALPTTDPFAVATIDPFAAGVVPTTDPFAFVPTIDPFAGGVAQVPTEASLFQEQQPLQQQQIDPVFLTATAIISAATATEAYNMTATAQGFGIGIPTLTLTPSPTTFIIGQPQQPGTGTDCVHTVVAGQNLFRIAMQYNVDLQTLASYNSISNPGVILVGQQITIPGCGGTTGQPTTGLTAVPPVTGGTGCASPYTVQQGDTLFKISLRCGVPVMSIASANGISNINLILINQQLTIPPG